MPGWNLSARLPEEKKSWLNRLSLSNSSIWQRLSAKTVATVEHFPDGTKELLPGNNLADDDGEDLPLPKELAYLVPPQPSACLSFLPGTYEPPYGYGAKANAVDSLVFALWWLRRANPKFLLYVALIFAAQVSPPR